MCFMTVNWFKKILSYILYSMSSPSSPYFPPEISSSTAAVSPLYSLSFPPFVFILHCCESVQGSNASQQIVLSCLSVDGYSLGHSECRQNQSWLCDSTEYPAFWGTSSSSCCSSATWPSSNICNWTQHSKCIWLIRRTCERSWCW